MHSVGRYLHRTDTASELSHIVIPSVIIGLERTSLEFERRLPTFANIGKQDKGYAGSAQTSRTLRIGRPGTDMVWFSFTPCGFWQWRFSTCLVGGLSNCEVGIGIGPA